MRTALLRRRRRGPSLPADLVALLEQDPDVLAYPSVELETLYQDPAATVLAGPGDPCGGMRDPVTREIVATQPTDSQRMIVGADGRSLESDGVSQNLIIDYDPGPDFTGTDSTGTMIMRVARGTKTGSQCLIGAASSTAIFGVFIRTEPERIELQGRADGTGIRVVGPEAFEGTDMRVVGARTDGLYELFIDGSMAASGAILGGSANSISTPFRIGCRSSSSGSPEFFAEATFGPLAIYGRALSDAVIASLS